MLTRTALFAAIVAVSSLPALEPTSITIITSKALPKGGTVTIVPPGKPAPGEKDHQATATHTDFSQPVPLPDAGPFDVYFTPKRGQPVKVVSRWKPAGEKPSLTLSDHLGTVFVRGDDLPRADAVIVTATDDPGPGEKGHRAVQKALDYKEDLVVPAGTYAVWVVPFNGAKAQRIADNIRVLAGREVKVPE